MAVIAAHITSTACGIDRVVAVATPVANHSTGPVNGPPPRNRATAAMSATMVAIMGNGGAGPWLWNVAGARATMRHQNVIIRIHSTDVLTLDVHCSPVALCFILDSVSADIVIMEEAAFMDQAVFYEGRLVRSCGACATAE